MQYIIFAASMPVDEVDELSANAGEENIHGGLMPPLNDKYDRAARHLPVRTWV